jgi:hypothetical protein
VSLATQLSNDLAKAFLNSNEFAETLTYNPFGLPSRPIAATVDRSQLQIRPNSNHKTRTEEITIFTYADPVLGIDNPQTGDSVQLAGDSIAQKWDFIERLHLSVGGMTLKFRRTVLQRAGASKPDQL